MRHLVTILEALRNPNTGKRKDLHPELIGGTKLGSFPRLEREAKDPAVCEVTHKSHRERPKGANPAKRAEGAIARTASP